VRFLQIVGRKKSGKTSLVVRLIPLLQARGLRVGSIKHSSHPHSLDREGTDSWLHREAGAAVTIGITAAAVSVHLPLPADPAALEALIERELGDLDLVLIEGWSERRGPKIEVVPPDAPGRPKPPRFEGSDDLLAVVLGPGVRAAGVDAAGSGAAAPGAPPVRRFGWGEIAAVAEFVDAWLRRA
jgi:molybdopterin-guanine dinucleotide biosynthesis protein MobB